MENYQKIEQLVNKAGCSYEDAKNALEGNGWDMIDAIISLEREGKVKKETVEKKYEEASAGAPEFTTEVISVNKGQKSSDGYDAGSAGKSGNAENSDSSDRKEGRPKRERKFWKRCKSIMVNNRMVILRSNGEQIIDLPIFVPVVALLLFFWATLVIALIAMLFGCRFHFEGEDLGKTNINNTMDKATDYAEKVKDNLTGKNKDEQDSNN